jgi:hypothetical protein
MDQFNWGGSPLSDSHAPGILTAFAHITTASSHGGVFAWQQCGQANERSIKKVALGYSTSSGFPGFHDWS